MKTDYRTYRLTVRDRTLYGLLGLAAAAAVSVFFYRSIWVFLVLGPAAFFLVPRLMRKKLGEARRKKLLSEFLQMLSILSGYLTAGLSVANAYGETFLQLEKLLGKNAIMTREMKNIAGRISMNESPADLFCDLADRSGIRDLANFSEVFLLAERSGGSMAKIIADTTGILKEKAAVSEEIRTQTSSRRYEQKLMNFMPFLVIGYLTAASPGFLDVMYETAAGRILMSGGLLLCIGALVLSDRFLEIET